MPEQKAKELFSMYEERHPFVRGIGIQGFQVSHLSQVHEGFVYDAFISYSSKDATWVREALVPRLERGGVADLY